MSKLGKKVYGTHLTEEQEAFLLEQTKDGIPCSLVLRRAFEVYMKTIAGKEI